MLVPVSASERAAVPVVGTVLLVAVTVLLASTVGVVALGLGEQVESEQPTTAFETETSGDRVAFVHQAGETIDGDQLSVDGGEVVSKPETVAAGDRVAVQPDAGVDDVALVYEDEAGTTTHLLGDASVPAGSPDATGVVLESGTLLDSHDDQCEAGALEPEFSDPVTVQVELEGTVDTTETLEVAVRDHLDDCGAPRDGASGTTDVTFTDGVGSFTIESAGTDDGADFDLQLPCLWLGGPCDVNDIESITVETSSGTTDVDHIVVGA